jgi:hypothetical protein
MRRLTEYVGKYPHGRPGKTYAEAIESTDVCRGEFEATACVERLAAYEDTGLSPEEVQELAKAKADGRLKILPAKPGDIIYRSEALQFCWVITKVEIYEDEIVFIDDSDNIFRLDDIGKTVFLTCEEAEKALEVRE